MVASLATFNLFIYFFYLFISDPKASIYAHTRKKKRKRNINPKIFTLEKYKFKTKFAQNIGNKTIYTISPMTLMTIIFLKIFLKIFV